MMPPVNGACYADADLPKKQDNSKMDYEVKKPLNVDLDTADHDDEGNYGACALPEKNYDDLEKNFDDPNYDFDEKTYEFDEKTYDFDEKNLDYNGDCY